jgi:signal transduction histidine kinase
MRERVEGLGGTFAIISRPGGGFLVDVTVPLARHQLAGDRR